MLEFFLTSLDMRVTLSGSFQLLLSLGSDFFTCLLRYLITTVLSTLFRVHNWDLPSYN